MAEAIFLASTLVMALLVVGVVALMVRGRRWHHYTPQAAYGQLSAGGGQPASAIGRLANTPSVWTAAFFLLAVGFLIGATAAVSGTAPVVAGTALVATLGVVVVLYLVGGVYIAVRGNGRPRAQAVAASAVTLGALLLLVLTVRLVLSG